MCVEDPAIGIGLALVILAGLAVVVCLVGYCSLKRDERKIRKMSDKEFLVGDEESYSS